MFHNLGKSTEGGLNCPVHNIQNNVVDFSKKQCLLFVFFYITIGTVKQITTIMKGENIMGWKILLPQEIMEEGRKLLEDAGHTLIMGRGFETEDVLADMKEHKPDAMIVRITPITREVIEANPNLKVIVRHGAGFDALDVKACHDNGVQTLYAPVANSTSVAETGNRSSIFFVSGKKYGGRISDCQLNLLPFDR